MSSSPRAKCLRENQEDVASTDRISALPDDLLVQILLLVSTKDEVATSVLSKRWRSVWTMVPKLEFTGDRKQNYTSGNIRSVFSFLNKSMELHKEPVLETLRIHINNDRINTRNLISNAVDRSVRVLEFNLLRSTTLFAQLPQSLYTCKTLVELTLSYSFHVDVPSLAYLPSLKKLLLALVDYKDEDSLVRLLSSCSVLVRSTISLSVADKWKSNFPKKNVLLPVRVLCRSDDKFLRSLPLVTSLLLCVQDLNFSGITFSRLQRVKLSIISDDWLSLLLLLLNNSPTLRFLHINSKNGNYSLSWKEPRFIPRCISSHLEVFEWKQYRGGKDEKQLLIYIFANPNCLKMAKINVSLYYSAIRVAKRKMLTELKSMPRVSIMSQILVS